MYLHACKPGSYVWLVVIMVMIKKFTRFETIIIHPNKVEFGFDLLDAHILRQVANDCKQLMKYLARLVQDVTYWAPAVRLVNPGIDLIIALQLHRPGW